MKQLRSIVVIVALAVAALSIQIVGAQPTLVGADPPPDSVVPETPEELQVTFDMELDSELSRVELVNPTGSTIAEGGVDPDDADATSMTIDLPDDVPPGEYTVTWTVVGAEDAEQQEMQGEYTFTIDPTVTPTSEQTVVIEDPVGTIEPIGGEDEIVVDDDDGISRGALIVGGVAILVAIAVVATINRRRFMR